MWKLVMQAPFIVGELPSLLQRQGEKAIRSDNVAHAAVVLVVIALALVLALGLATAWWVTCQRKGMYPALDMPSFKSGGTWKAYCAR